MNPSSFRHLRIKGFTIIETLVATFIITMVILGPLTVATNASSYAQRTKDTMIATYLAQEALELLRHQQDSIFIRCTSSASTACTPIQSGGVYELPKQAAWRIFRERLDVNTGGPSCFASVGCAYDVIDMTTNEDGYQTKYLPTGTECSKLALTPSKLYVCSGVSSHIGGTSINTFFSRKVTITAVDTFTETGTKYNDDFRVTATVTITRPNGLIRQVKVVDFLHARS
jgi:type II secretory pathway pseudopilin PulG